MRNILCLLILLSLTACDALRGLEAASLASGFVPVRVHGSDSNWNVDCTLNDTTVRMTHSDCAGQGGTGISVQD
jgi:hypothetical protein